MICSAIMTKLIFNFYKGNTMLNYNELKSIAVKMSNDGLTDYEKSLPPEVLTEMINTRGFGPETSPAPAEPGFMDKLKGFGKEYGAATGIGAGAGAIAGIPIALLAHALMADPKNKGLRDYLKSGLLGALLGGGAGALGGAGLRGYLQSDPNKALGFSRLVDDYLPDNRTIQDTSAQFINP